LTCRAGLFFLLPTTIFSYFLKAQTTKQTASNEEEDARENVAHQTALFTTMYAFVPKQHQQY